MLHTQISIPVWCDFVEVVSTMLLCFYCNFNSSMVRFCESPFTSFLNIRPLFQFQYGAILWVNARAKEPLRTFISIPVWCDFVHNEIFNFHFVIRISIPVWCDFVKADLLPILTRLFYFNSSMVRFCVRAAINEIIIVAIFQFQYGAILCSSSNTLISSFTLFQFQYGAILWTQSI